MICVDLRCSNSGIKMSGTLVLNGDWVGQSVANSSLTWQLHVDGRHAKLDQFSKDQLQQIMRFECRLSETPFTFTFGESCEEFTGIALDMNYVVIVGLDEGSDVIFSRPGLVELFTREAYAGTDLSTRPGRFSLSRWAAA
jgi:hypothetical protein